MDMLTTVSILSVLTLVLVMAVSAVVRGRKGMKNSRKFETTDIKIKAGYWIISALHMWAGIFITIVFVFYGAVMIMASLGV